MLGGYGKYYAVIKKYVASASPWKGIYADLMHPHNP